MLAYPYLSRLDRLPLTLESLSLFTPCSSVRRFWRKRDVGAFHHFLVDFCLRTDHFLDPIDDTPNPANAEDNKPDKQHRNYIDRFACLGQGEEDVRKCCVAQNPD